MTISKKIIFASIALLSSTQLFASNPDCPNVHIWDTVFVADGKWQASLQVINEADHAWFVAPDCSKINSFIVSKDNVQQSGFAMDEQANFNVAYTLTFTEQESTAHFTSKVCVFVVTAKSPAKPDITAISYNGAKCSWKLAPGSGDNFYIG